MLLLLSHFSRTWLCVTPWTVARQAPLSMGFSRQEHWSGLPCPRPGDLPNPGMEPGSPALQVDSLPRKWVTKEALRVYGVGRAVHLNEPPPVLRLLKSTLSGDFRPGFKSSHWHFWPVRWACLLEVNAIILVWLLAFRFCLPFCVITDSNPFHFKMFPNLGQELYG